MVCAVVPRRTGGLPVAERPFGVRVTSSRFLALDAGSLPVEA
jgi:hypothetical protein